MTEVREFEGRPVPAVGTWVLDSAETTIRAVARHLMVSKVRGAFGSFSGTVVVAEDPTESAVEVHIDTASIDTGDDWRDGNLRSPNFLDAEHYPPATFVSTEIVAARDRWLLTGDLTVRGSTQPVQLDLELLGMEDDTVMFAARGAINREDWGLVWNGPLEAGGVLVGKEIRLEIRATLHR